jgi:class 3 adenylate cyclase/tetratricopeptide (TPR) repeat protein
MKCPKCRHENIAQATHCEKCAAPLGQTCANCGSPASSTDNFCSQCGHRLEPVANDPRFASPRDYTPRHLADKILVSRLALEGERKQVTVLFADIKGSTGLLTDLDPEDAQKLLDPVLECMIEAVHRYEGTVNNVMGDGIMALFGAPLAHEDHAVRACYGALGMHQSVARYSDQVQRLHGVPITLRAGLNSGEIVVRAISNDLRMDYTVVAQTLNLAARMEQIARPGSTLITANTFKLAEGYVLVRSLGRVPVKGVSDPLQVYELTGAGSARTRLQAAIGRGLTRFIGRDVEMQELRRALQLASKGQGQVMAMVGEAGVGKSRLVHEFVHSRHPAECVVLEASSVSYGRAIPYLPVIDLLQQYFKIDVRDSARSIYEKVSGKLLMLDASLLDTIPPILDLLGVLEQEHPFRSLHPVQHRQSTYQAVIRLLLSEASIRTLIVVFEDVHWHDSLSLGLLNALVAEVADSPLLLLVAYRPHFKDDWGNQPNYHELHLNPLVGDDLTELVEVLLGSAENLTALKSFVMERASGNPFFAEEIVRALADSGVLQGARGNYRLERPLSSVEVPPTLHAILAARIDALPAAEKRVLQEAAVIGYDIPLALLRAISGLPHDELDGLLSSLRDAELLYAEQLFPEPQYRFKHAFTHDVAYNGVLRDRRRDIHARIVEAMEKLYADRLGEQMERLAHHAVHGELKEKAVHYVQQAGGKAAARTAFADARTCFEQALDILKSLPQSPAHMEQAFEIRLALRSVLRLVGEVRQMLEQLREAEKLAERLKDDRRRGQVCAFMATVLTTFGDLDEALVTGNRALEIARDLGDLRLRILATSHLEMAHYYRADYEQVVELGRKNLAELPPDWVHEYFGMAVPASVFCRAYLVLSLAELGRFADATRYEVEAIQVAQPTRHAHTIGFAQFAASMLHLSQGQWVKARLLIEQWINTCRVLQTPSLLPWAVASSAWALAQVGEAVEAVSRIEEAEEMLKRQMAREINQHRSWADGALGRACLLLGRVDEARRLGRRSVESARRQPGFTAHALWLLGDVATHPDQFDPESGAAHYRQALALAERHGMRPLVAHCRFGLAKLEARVGGPEHARENLTAATTMYREMGMDFWLEQALGMSDSGQARRYSGAV